MQQPNKSEAKKEWACRILLTLQVVLLSYIYYAVPQTKSQLVSPLIHPSTVNTIITDLVSYYYKPCIFLSIGLAIALWLYFFKKRLGVIVVSAGTIIGFEIWTRYFIN